jgi:hypothetical protein
MLAVMTLTKRASTQRRQFASSSSLAAVPLSHRRHPPVGAAAAVVATLLPLAGAEPEPLSLGAAAAAASSALRRDMMAELSVSTGGRAGAEALSAPAPSGASPHCSTGTCTWCKLADGRVQQHMGNSQPPSCNGVRAIVQLAGPNCYNDWHPLLTFLYLDHPSSPFVNGLTSTVLYGSCRCTSVQQLLQSVVNAYQSHHHKLSKKNPSHEALSDWRLVHPAQIQKPKPKTQCESKPSL